jgi:sugar phosphate isomerase/epimerase
MNLKNFELASQFSRRRFLKTAAGVAALPLVAHAQAKAPSKLSATEGGQASKICIFSKHLQWLDYQEMARTAREIGFDGIDLTVRPGGHVEPQKVRDDLPKAVEAVRAAGLDVPTITTAVTDPTDKLTADILETASRAGIAFYRMGYYEYQDSKGIQQTLDEAKPMLRDLVEMNKQYKIAGTYQNHSGPQYVGACVWDLYYLIKDLDPRWIGSQFDIRHATVEGGTVWPVHFRLLREYINTLVAKDFRWARVKGAWQPENCPLGEGMVDFPRFFKMLRSGGPAGIADLFCLHLEYPLGGAENGARRLTGDKQQVIDAMRKDLQFLRKSLA